MIPSPGRIELRPWTWGAATYACAGALIFASLAAYLPREVYLFVTPYFYPPPYDFAESLAWVEYVLAQSLYPLLTLWFILALSVHRGYQATHLWTAAPSWEISRWAALLVGVAAYTAFEQFLFLHIVPDSWREDIRPFIDMLQSPLAPFVAFAAVVLAPLAEELVFRRILFDSFAETWLRGFGAAVLTSAVWAVIHDYSWTATGAIFVSGLLLCLLRQASRSLWPPIAAHAAANAYAVAAISYSLPATP
jgi:uncharacterized protein